MILQNRRKGFYGNDQHAKLIVRADGADASTDFIDVSASNHTITANGNAQVDTAQKKFENASALFDGTDDYLSVPYSSDFYMGTGLFALDLWVRFAALPTGGAYAGFFNQRLDVNNDLGLAYLEGTPDTLEFWTQSGGATKLYIKKTWEASINIWYHVLVTRGWGGNANDLALAIDGTILDAPVTDTDEWPDLSAAAFHIGQIAGPAWGLNGWINEFRVVKEKTPWIANFDPFNIEYR